MFFVPKPVVVPFRFSFPVSVVKTGVEWCFCALSCGKKCEAPLGDWEAGFRDSRVFCRVLCRVFCPVFCRVFCLVLVRCAVRCAVDGSVSVGAVIPSGTVCVFIVSLLLSL